MKNTDCEKYTHLVTEEPFTVFFICAVYIVTWTESEQGQTAWGPPPNTQNYVRYNICFVRVIIQRLQ